MIGIRVTKESALAEVDALVSETRAEIHGATKYGAIPRDPERFLKWITPKEQRLATLECLRALLLPLAPNTVLQEAEQEAASI